MLYRISVAERGLTGIRNIFRSRLSGLDDLLRAGTVPLMTPNPQPNLNTIGQAVSEIQKRGMRVSLHVRMCRDTPPVTIA